jgi:MinD-like ATPase involved in chromosome partitioning or flagellar assembly
MTDSLFTSGDESDRRLTGPSAAELTEDSIVRHRGDVPGRGWRRAVYVGSGHLINPGPSPQELARQDWLRRVRRPLPGFHQIGVTSIKGGVGKTTVAACLGLVMAENRGDRVIVLDANPDAGTLADRLTGESSVTVRDLLNNLNNTRSLTDVAHFTSLVGRLQVLASEQDPAMSDAFNREEYERVCQVLTRFYNVLITDSGTGLVHSAMEGTLALANSLVIVGAPTVDGASRASKTLDWLRAHGHEGRAARAIVVLSCDRSSAEIDRERLLEHFQARCRAVVQVPHDPHLATGGRINLHALQEPTRDAFLEIAAYLADDFDPTAPTMDRRGYPAPPAGPPPVPQQGPRPSAPATHPYGSPAPQGRPGPPLARPPAPAPPTPPPMPWPNRPSPPPPGPIRPTPG